MSHPALIDLTDDRKPVCDRHLLFFWGGGVKKCKIVVEITLIVDFNWATAGLHDRCTIVALEVSINVPYN